MRPDTEAGGIREALDQLAAADIADVVAQARAAARERVRAILADALADAMLERVRALTSRPQPRAAAPAAAAAAAAPDAGELAWYVYGVVRADARPAQALEACEHVRGHGKADHVADVTWAVGVRPRRRDEDCSRHLR